MSSACIYNYNFKEMSTKNLIRMLRDYGKTRKGEISDLTLAASGRLQSLYLRNKELEEQSDA